MVNKLEREGWGRLRQAWEAKNSISDNLLATFWRDLDAGRIPICIQVMDTNSHSLTMRESVRLIEPPFCPGIFGGVTQSDVMEGRDQLPISVVFNVIP
jgi:hypothetical protein